MYNDPNQLIITHFLIGTWYLEELGCVYAEQKKKHKSSIHLGNSEENN